MYSLTDIKAYMVGKALTSRMMVPARLRSIAGTAARAECEAVADSELPDSGAIGANIAAERYCQDSIHVDGEKVRLCGEGIEKYREKGRNHTHMVQYCKYTTASGGSPEVRGGCGCGLPARGPDSQHSQRSNIRRDRTRRMPSMLDVF